MQINRRSLLAAGAATTVAALSRARAQANTIRLGVLTDMSGPYRDSTGPASLLMTQVAAEAFANRGFNIEVIGADHQNKPDVGANIARQWYDQGMDAIVDVPTSSVAFAVNQIAREKNKVFLNSGAASSDLTGPQCSPNTVHWTYDTYMLAKGTGGAIVRTGGDTWYFVTADYAFGHALQRDTTRFVEAAGGRVLGSARYPFPQTTDFSAFVVQAQASRAKVLGMANASGDTWYFVTADYAFGHALQRDTTRFVEAAGGRVVGASRYPFPQTTDFSAFVLQAQASRAKVLGMANASGDTINTIKAAREFGLHRSMKLAALLMSSTDIHGLGLEAGQGLLLTEAFYWDLNDRTRALTSRVRARNQDRPPSQVPAGCYGATLHYLKAVADMGVAAAKADGRAAVARMKAMPTDDDAFGPGRIREDGRKLHPVYLFEVKTPAESTGPWDFYKVVATTPAEEAFRPLAEGGCPFVHS